MIKWKKNLALLAAAAAVASGVAVQAEDAAMKNLEQLFYTYCQGNMVFEAYDANYLEADHTLEQTGYDAFLALKQTDLNGDGAQELLAVRVKPENGGNDIIAEVYVQQENKLQRIAQYTLAEDVLDTDTARLDVFLAETQDGQIVCCESSDTASVLADGTDWNFCAAAFDGSSFYEYQSARIVGSSWPDDEEMNRAVSALGALGLYPAQPVTVAVVDQVGNLVRLNAIERQVLVTYDELSAYFNGGSSDSMQYGETFFYSYANEGLENKLPQEFTSELERMQPQGAAFVFADSNARLLTAEDLAGCTEYELFLARNEIYARHGRIFKNEELDSYFCSQAWYEPSIAGSDFTEEYAAQIFNEFEIQNIAAIVSYEKEHGLNDYAAQTEEADGQ